MIKSQIAALQGEPPSAAGRRVHYLSGGDGESTLVLHGLTDWARVWEPAWTNLPGRIIAPDLRGHGLSIKPRHGYTFSEFAADAAALVVELNAAPVVVLGHSLGGIIALYAAALYPHLFRAAILIDSSLRWEMANVAPFLDGMKPLRGRSFEELVARVEKTNPEWSDQDIQHRVSGLRHFSPYCARALPLENPEQSFIPIFAKLHCRTLHISGQAQLGSVLNNADRKVLGTYPQVQTVQIRGAGHSPQREQPYMFWKAVRQFLAG